MKVHENLSSLFLSLLWDGAQDPASPITQCLIHSPGKAALGFLPPVPHLLPHLSPSLSARKSATSQTEPQQMFVVCAPNRHLKDELNTSPAERWHQAI